MATTNNSQNPLSSRLEELRSARTPQSPPRESVYSGYATPTRFSTTASSSSSAASALLSNASPLVIPSADSSIGKVGLQRRSTADSGSVPTLSPIGQAPTKMENMDLTASTVFKVQANQQLERKRQELENAREQRRRLDAEFELYTRLEEEKVNEIRQMASDLRGLNLSPSGSSTSLLQHAGHQSEPTTPPEYRSDVHHAFSSVSSRRNRYSTSSSGIVSPPRLNRYSTAGPAVGTQIVNSPQESVLGSAALSQSKLAGTPSRQNGVGKEGDKLPSKSVPGSRRGSSDRLSSYLPDSSVIAPKSTSGNRYSLPATSSINLKRESVPEYPPLLGSLDTSSFLFDESESDTKVKESTASPDVKNYFKTNNEDNFPMLVRDDRPTGKLSALDLALSQMPGSESHQDTWQTFSRHRHSQYSLPQNVFDAQKSSQQGLTSPTSTTQQSFDNVVDSPTAVRQPNRHSMEASLSSLAQKSIFTPSSSSIASSASSGRPGLGEFPSSYSTNDIPTLKNIEIGAQTSISNSQSMSFHNHNVSLGRIPAGGFSGRTSRDFSGSTIDLGDKSVKPSELQANVSSFGPAPTVTSTNIESPKDSGSAGSTPASATMPQPMNHFAANSTYNGYGGYGMQLNNMGMTPMMMGGANGNGAASLFNNQFQLYQAQQSSPFANGSGAFSHHMGRFTDGNQMRAMQQHARRLQNAEENARFSNTKIEAYQGEIYQLCKDQHGCRYLQKQLETRNPDTVQMIFVETNPHVVELMTDPFGNYLCQKLLEHTNDAQRTVFVNNAAPQMVEIAFNQHGTRALQKMIEYISTPEQIQTVIHALKDKVVELIQDLNGNHVIQKCLNKLVPDYAQFIFDAVGTNCVVVGTHRHGCCVLQRCIDHASGQQKVDLIAHITQNAFSLVKDPYGNYVLQYIIDLNDPAFTNPLCYSFQTHIPELSKQKFSSNVIEKCLRHAEPAVASMMIEEMLSANELEKMLRDQFANYVVQTALDHAPLETKSRLVDAIRPILPSIRQTPYGRRLHSKILAQDTAGFGPSNGIGDGSINQQHTFGTFGSVAQRGLGGPVNAGFGNPSSAGMFNPHQQTTNGFPGGFPATSNGPNGAMTGPTGNIGGGGNFHFSGGQAKNFMPTPIQSNGAYGRGGPAPTNNGFNFF